MAIGGKTLGITAGLAVGLSSGIMLAAFNPVLPRTDTTNVLAQEPEIASAPEIDAELDYLKPEVINAQNEILQIEETDPSLNGISADISIGEAKPIERISRPTAEPIDDLVPLEVANDASSSADPVNLANVELVESPTELQKFKFEAAPSIQTQSAATLDLAMPDVDEANTEVHLSTPTSENISPLEKETEVASLFGEESTVEPEQFLPQENTDIEPSNSSQTSISVQQKDEPNTSGTFKTSGGSFITQKGSGDRSSQTRANQFASFGSSQKSSRFPTIGDTQSEPTPSVDDSSELGALLTNAIEFPISNTPVLSVILIDDGKITNQLSDLKKLDIPFAIAVPVDDPNAASKAVSYQTAGFEVLAMAPRSVSLSLTGGQTKDQVADLLQQYFDMMPQALGLIDRPAAVLQKDQRLLNAVVSYFETTGHGLITYAGGLNGSKRIADQKNVLNGEVFKFVDKSGETGPPLLQELDRVAREARSKDRAIVMATASNATLLSFAKWRDTPSARGVTLAPISANLLKE